MNRHAAPIAVAALLAAATIAGCSGDADRLIPRGETVTENPEYPGGHGPPPDSEEPSGETTDTSAPETEYPETIDLRAVDLPVSAEDAVATATGDAGSGFVYEIELDYSRDAQQWVYEVKILDGASDHEYAINAVTGDIAGAETDTTDDAEQEIILGDPMELSEALTLATDVVNEPLRGWTYKYDDGALVYEFDLGPPRDTVEVVVDVVTGKASRG